MYQNLKRANKKNKKIMFHHYSVPLIIAWKMYSIDAKKYEKHFEINIYSA